MPPLAIDPRTGLLLLRPTPLLVGEEVAKVPPGQLLTLAELRARLAARCGAARACPLATARSARVLAGVVAQDLRLRRKPRWPIWRLVQDNGVLPPRWALDALYRASPGEGMEPPGPEAGPHTAGFTRLDSAPGGCEAGAGSACALGRGRTARFAKVPPGWACGECDPRV